MNKVILIGRLVADPEIKYTTGDKPLAVARYRLAVDRKYKKEGEQAADFINCVAFASNGDFAQKYLHKGTKIAVVGRIQTGNYTKQDGTKVYTTDVVVEEHYFCESRSSGGSVAPAQPTDSDGFMDIPDNIGDELPFN